MGICGAVAGSQKFEQPPDLIICGLKFDQECQNPLRRRGMGCGKSKATERSKTEEYPFHQS